MKYCTIFILLFLLYISSCEKNTDKNVFETEAKMDQFSNQDIQKLLNKKIFFGHMSVGYNIIDGLNDIIREDARFFGFSIFEITDGVNILDSVILLQNVMRLKIICLIIILALNLT